MASRWWLRSRSRATQEILVQGFGRPKPCSDPPFALIAKVYGAPICSWCSSGSWLVSICPGWSDELVMWAGVLFFVMRLIFDLQWFSDRFVPLINWFSIRDVLWLASDPGAFHPLFCGNAGGSTSWQIYPIDPTPRFLPTSLGREKLLCMQFGCSACDYMHGKQSLSYSATHVCKSFGSTLSGGIKDKGPYTRAPFGVARWPNTLHLLGCRPVRPRPRHPCTHQVLKLFVHLTWAIAAHCPEAFVPLPGCPKFVWGLHALP